MNNKGLSYSDKWYFGKAALVTGATSGIGREIARQLISRGCRVMLCGRNSAAMKSLMEELNANSTTCAEGFLADLSDRKSLQELISKINKDHDIDILVNNAGLGYMSDFHLMPKEAVCSMQEVNMSAIVTLCREFLPRMIAKSGGGILNVGSVASFFATPGSALYGATKQFILGFTDALHREMLPFGVHVTGVYPGHTRTRFIERATAGRIVNWRRAMEPSAVSVLALKGLSENRIRVIPGFGNTMRALAGRWLPIPIILDKVYDSAIKHTGKQQNGE